jgi:signal peptidase I
MSPITALCSTLLTSLLVLQPLLCMAEEPSPPSLLARMKGWETLAMPSANMDPALKPEEVLLVDLKEHRSRPLRTLDIVAYNVAVDPGLASTLGRPVVYIMRVVAVAGDRVSVAGGLVIRNRQAVPDPYANLSQLNAISANAKEVLVPFGHVYVLGDNRGNSNDSRFNGPIAVRSIRGIVKFAGRSSIIGPFRSVEPVPSQ